MAMKDLYRNRLLKRTSAESKFTDGATPQPTTIDGSGRPYNVERFGYNPDYQELKNNSQNSTTPNNSTPTSNMEKNVISNPTNSTWRDYADLINAKTANSKMELQTAMQRAQSASNDYLKALGLQGSGVGQSQLTDIGVQYQNALNNANRQAQSDVNNQLDTDFREMVDTGKYSSSQLQDYINRYGEQTGMTNSWNNYLSGVGATLDGSISKTNDSIQEIIDSNKYDTTTNNALKNLQYKLNNASTEAEYNDLIKENEALLSDPEHFRYIVDYTNGKPVDNWSSNFSSSSAKALEDALTNAINNGKVTSGSTISFMDENRKPQSYLYVSGKLYKLDTSKIGKTNNWRAYQIYYDGEKIKESNNVQIWG